MEHIGFYYKAAIKLQQGINNIELCNDHVLHFGSRDEVEELDNAVQPICTGILLTKDNKILTVHKTNKSVSKNSPEKQKTLLYIGGHLDMVDKDCIPTTAFLKGAKREIFEELGIDIFQNCNKILKSYAIYNPTSTKLSKHFGVMHTLLLNEEFEPHFTDGKAEFVPIAKLSQVDNLEDWSKYIIDEIKL